LELKEDLAVTILRTPSLETSRSLNPPTWKDERSLIAEHVQRWGCAASIALLDPACEIFTAPDIDGIIGYRRQFGCAVVLGDPVGTPSDIPSLVQAFHRYCEEHGWRIVYAVVSERFAQWAMRNVCSALVQIGEELIFDLHDDPQKGAKGRKLRNKISHSRRTGVTVQEYLVCDKALEYAIEQVGIAWLKGRRGPQIYLAHIDLFADRGGKRWFYAQQGDKIIGVLLLNRLESREGWLFNLLLTTPEAPSGTSELLVVSALQTLHLEDYAFVSFGTVPIEQLEEIEGLGLISTSLARMFFKGAKWIFHLNARKTYWKKFNPNSERIYVLFSRPNIGLREVFGVMRALNVSL
jgi:lysylphosphatidylglycerol synthetase-like protein (DUF2156 family)